MDKGRRQAFRRALITATAFTVLVSATRMTWSADPANFDELSRRLAELEESNQELRDQVEALSNSGGGPASRLEGLLGDNLLFSGEGGVGFFESGPEGAFANAEFRVDELILFLEARLAGQVFLFTEIFGAQREAEDFDLNLGEVYVDLEDLSDLWGAKRILNLRLGRMDIPFGEEYLHRDAIDNPLISHSLADFWGVDEGIEIYGDAGVIDYVLAVQNGGHPTTIEGDSDKAVVIRVGAEPASWLRLSLSAMRTGDLDVEDDELSELWFGGGFVRAIGDPETTDTFSAELLQFDARGSWRGGHLAAAVGSMDYSDDDSAADNDRSAVFGALEAVQHLTRRYYLAGRYSFIQTDDGMPIVGLGEFDRFFKGYLTEEIRRLGLGVGCRWNENLLVKAEYSFERGEEIDDTKLDDQDMVSAEVAFRF